MTIKLTFEQYHDIHELRFLASWYVQEHENASANPETIADWEQDKQVLDRALAILDKINGQILEPDA